MINQTISAVERKLAKFRFHPEYRNSVSKEVIREMIHEADFHSAALERTTEPSEVEKEKEYYRLKEARKLLYSNGITRDTLSCLGNILEPEKNPVRQFRRAEIEFGYNASGSTMSREFKGAPAKIVPFKMDDLVARLDFSQDIHPIKKAVELHIGLVEIHPYADGNGRAARLVQNVFLEGTGYVPAIISSSEKNLYLKLMADVLKSRLAGQSELMNPSASEELFQEFIANKVLLSTERLEKELEKKRAYTVYISKSPSTEVSMKIKHLLTGNPGDPLSIRFLSDRKAKNVIYGICGNISLEDVTKRVSKITQRYDLTAKVAAGYEIGLNGEAKKTYY